MIDKCMNFVVMFFFNVKWKNVFKSIIFCLNRSIWVKYILIISENCSIIMIIYWYYVESDEIML